MAEKTTVTITMGEITKTFSGDAAVVLVVDKVFEFQRGEVKQLEAFSSYIGKDIPDSILVKTIASTLSRVIKAKSDGDPVKESFNLHDLSGFLEEESEKVMKAMTPQQQLQAMEYAIKELQRLSK